MNGLRDDDPDILLEYREEEEISGDDGAAFGCLPATCTGGALVSTTAAAEALLQHFIPKL